MQASRIPILEIVCRAGPAGAVVATVLTLAVCVPINLTHEWFRDEAHLLLIVRSNSSLSDLYQALRYEGTPGLWHFLLWCIDRIVPLAPWGVNAIHAVVLASTILAAGLALPLPAPARLTLVLQPCFVWFAWNTRQYTLGTLLVLCWTILAVRQAERPGTAATACLALAAQTSLHMGVVAFALFAYDCLRLKALTPTRAPWAWSIMSASGALLVLQLLLPPDLMEGLRSWTPLGPGFDKSLVWVLFSSFFSHPLVVTAGISMTIISPILALRLDRAQGLFALVTLLGIFAAFVYINYFKYSHERHHWCWTFGIVAVVSILWNSLLFRDAISRLILGLVTGVALLGSILNIPDILRNAYISNRSAGQAAAAFLDKEFPGKDVLAISEEFESAIRVYRKKPGRTFALRRNKFVQWTVWNHPSVDYRTQYMAQNIYFSEMREALLKTPVEILESEPIVIVSGLRIYNDLGVPNAEPFSERGFRMVYVRSFRSETEDFRIYRIERTESDSP